MECNTHIIEKKIICTIPSECSDKLRIKLEKEFNCKLMARTQTDTVHGAISIDHTPNKHVIRLDFYTKDEEPNNQHASKLKKLGKIPSMTECNKII